PAGSTLFAYTTLFRSARSRSTRKRVLATQNASLVAGALLLAAGLDGSVGACTWRSQRADPPTRCSGIRPPERLVGLGFLPVDDADRKSTRLNSSHVKI